MIARRSHLARARALCFNAATWYGQHPYLWAQPAPNKLHSYADTHARGTILLWCAALFQIDLTKNAKCHKLDELITFISECVAWWLVAASFAPIHLKQYILCGECAWAMLCRCPSKHIFITLSLFNYIAQMHPTGLQCVYYFFSRLMHCIWTRNTIYRPTNV